MSLKIDFRNKFSSLPIEKKLRLLITLICGVVLAFMCAAFIMYDALSYRSLIIKDLSTRIDIVGHNCAPALTFNDPAMAEEILTSLSKDARIVSAIVLTAEKTVFAKYPETAELDVNFIKDVTDGHRFHLRHIDLITPVYDDDDVLVGHIYVGYLSTALNDRIEKIMTISAVILVVALLGALLISAKLQHLITKPILSLAATAARVTATKDFSLRAEKTVSDELGTLVDNFNEMIQEIQLRDEALKKSHENLEALVAERTNELSVVNHDLEREIAEHQKAELELKASEAKYRILFNQIADPIFIFDKKNKKFLDCNDSVLKIYGYSREELLQMTPLALHPPEERDLVKRHLDETSDDKTLTYTHITKSGKQIFVEVSTNELNYQGRAAWISIVRDVTVRKKAAMELKRAKEAAEAASRAKSDFLANMSHEIRTPMNGVIGFIDLLRDTELDEQQLDYVETIQKSSDALLTVINDILDFSKIEAGKLTIEPIPFDPELVLQNITQLLAEKAEKKQLELILRYPGDMPAKVVGDPGRFRQILTNLVGNAIKFTEEGHVLVSVEIVDRSDSQITMGIKVQDTGIGIPKSKLRDIFGKFTQADTSTTRTYGGTGLGLPISKQLIELMGGELHLESKVGEGSTFSFKLTMPIAQTDDHGDSHLNADLSGVRVAIIDDNPINCKIAHEIVTDLGMRPEIYFSGRKALQGMIQAAKQSNPFRIAIVDYHMPEMNGEELGRRIADHDLLCETLLVLLTSVAQRGDAKRFASAGFAAYLTKPIHPSQLRETLSVVWSRTTTSKNAVTKHTLAEIKKQYKQEQVDQTLAQDVHILLVEDNLVNQKVARKMLTKLGCTSIDIAQNGQEAVEKMQSGTYDLIFMDCQMPVMDGFQATAAIRKMERHGSGDTQDLTATSPTPAHPIPIVAMTANTLKGDRERCIRAGMDDYISKPVKIVTLEAMLKKWLCRERPSVPADSDNP